MQHRCSAPELPSTRCGTGGAFPGDLVAVQGDRWSGHLGINLRTSLVSKSRQSGAAPKTRHWQGKLGRRSTSTADHEPSRPRHLQEMGGARVILATAPNSENDVELIDGLGPNGRAHGRRRNLTVPSRWPDTAHQWEQDDPRLGLGNTGRQRGHTALRRAVRRPSHDRGLSARGRGEGLCAHVERQRTIPRRFEDVNPPRRNSVVAGIHPQSVTAQRTRMTRPVED